MNIKDILVKIRFATDEQKGKGMLGFAKIRFRVNFLRKDRHIVIKGFVIRRSEYKDEFRGYCAVFPPSAKNRFGGYLKTVFFENEFFKEDKEFWEEIARQVLKEYYKQLKLKNSD